MILMLLALFSRPDLVPVGQAELRAVRQIERGLSPHGDCPQSPSPQVNFPQSAWACPAEARIPGRFVVGFEPGSADAAGAWIVRQGGRVVRVDEASGFVVADFPQACESQDGQLAQSASTAPGVRYFEPNVQVTAAGLPNDPYFIPYQWDKWVMYADQAWDIIGGSTDVKVAVVDEGIDWHHPDLAASFKTGELGYDFIGNDNDPQPDNPDAYHGTHVAGIIAATRDNNEGIAGWSLAQLMSVRVLNDTGSGTTDVVASGIRWATDHGARIINMSLTSPSSTNSMEEACQYAAQAGVLIVAASGNEGKEAIGFPAALSQCIAVGASSPDSRLASFSNYGAEQELVAPGDAIWSCTPGGSYEWARGTSMASPQVAGVAALILARNWGLSATEVRAVLDASAIDMGVGGRDIHYGYGLVNAKRAVDLAAAYAADRGLRGLSPNGDCPQVSGAMIIRAGAGLPSWVQQADVYDGSGRLVKTRNVGAGQLSLTPGTYFVRASTKDEGPRTRDEGLGTKSDVVRRLLVLD